MGTFTDYTGMTDVPENQCAKYARQMLGPLHVDGMMSADFGGRSGGRELQLSAVCEGEAPPAQWLSAHRKINLPIFE